MKYGVLWLVNEEQISTGEGHILLKVVDVPF